MTVDLEEVAAAPVRGTRPRNRRELILMAARELFYRRGYANVAMSDIAAAVAIGPSALYRHFRGKQELLHAVVAEALDSCLRGLSSPARGDLDSVVWAFAEGSPARRELGVLWQREARSLTAEQHAELSELLHEARRLVVKHLTVCRPELTADQGKPAGLEHVQCRDQRLVPARGTAGDRLPSRDRRPAAPRGDHRRARSRCPGSGRTGRRADAHAPFTARATSVCGHCALRRTRLCLGQPGRHRCGRSPEQPHRYRRTGTPNRANPH